MRSPVTGFSITSPLRIISLSLQSISSGISARESRLRAPLAASAGQTIRGHRRAGSSSRPQGGQTGARLPREDDLAYARIRGACGGRPRATPRAAAPPPRRRATARSAWPPAGRARGPRAPARCRPRARRATAAPRAVASRSAATSTGTRARSAWSCIRKLFAAAPPSARRTSSSIAHRIEHVAGLEARSPRARHGRDARASSRWSAPRSARARPAPSAARRGRRARGRSRRPRCSSSERASASVSAALSISPRPSRSHWIAAPATNTAPSSA